MFSQDKSTQQQTDCFTLAVKKHTSPFLCVFVCVGGGRGGFPHTQEPRTGHLANQRLTEEEAWIRFKQWLRKAGKVGRRIGQLAGGGVHLGHRGRCLCSEPPLSDKRFYRAPFQAKLYSCLASFVPLPQAAAAAAAGGGGGGGDTE